MAATKSKTIDPWKLKKWYPILAPEYMRKAFIGETPCESPEKVVNKEINISLAAVTGEIRKQSTNMTFRVIGFEGNNAITQVTRIEVSPSYIKRNVRKGRTRADDAFILKTADDEEIKIKPIIITKNKVEKSKSTLLRKLAKFELREYISKISYNQLIQDILSQKLQKTFAGILKKVCPLKTFEIRVIELVNKNKKAPEAKKVEEPKAEEKAVEKAAEETSKKTTQKKAKKKQEKTEEKEE